MCFRGSESFTFLSSLAKLVHKFALWSQNNFWVQRNTLGAGKGHNSWSTLNFGSLIVVIKSSIKDFFSKCGQIHSFLQIWLHLLKKSLMENFIFCTIIDNISIWKTINYCFIWPEFCGKLWCHNSVYTDRATIRELNNMIFLSCLLFDLNLPTFVLIPERTPMLIEIYQFMPGFL